ncbi:MAG TPA: hypothetical protein GX708_12475, partial [Gallicola sp.]|nr:hypothetical protein [Gallicola sp.]
IQLETEDYTSNLPYSAPAVKFLLENAGYKGDYTTKSKGTYLWYDTESHMVILRKLDDMIGDGEDTTELSFSPINVPVVSATDKKYEINNNIGGPEDLFLTKNKKPVILLGGNKGDNLVSAVRTIRNLGENKNNVQNLQLDKIANDELKNQLNSIVNHSLFVGKSYKSYYYKEYQTITNIIFSEEKDLELTIDKFPEKQTEDNPEGPDYRNLNSIIIPPNVKKVSPGAFDNLIEENKIIKLVLENKKTDVSEFNLDKYFAIVLGNNGTHYDEENNPYNWILQFNEDTIYGNLGYINAALKDEITSKQYAELSVGEHPDENGIFEVKIIIKEPDAGLFDEAFGPIQNGIGSALEYLFYGGVKSAHVFPIPIEDPDSKTFIDDFSDPMNVAVPVLGCFLGVDNMQNKDFNEVFLEVLQKVRDYKLSKLSDLVENSGKIQVVGHVEKNEKDGPTIYYNVFYTFKFVHQEGEAEEIG